MARHIESRWLDGPAGKLEALLEEPDDQAPNEACVVCHPHPLFGGTMNNKVVYHIARGLRRRGTVVLRFNFRGVSRSEGSHDQGTGEVDDARAALDWLRVRYSGLPCALAGFSFGARVVLKLGCSSEDVTRLIAVGFPTREGPAPSLETCPMPKFFITSTHDEFAPRTEMEALFKPIAEPKQLIWIEAADHFFARALDQLEETVRALA